MPLNAAPSALAVGAHAWQRCLPPVQAKNRRKTIINTIVLSQKVRPLFASFGEWLGMVQKFLPRLSIRPGKQLIYFLLHRDQHLSAGRRIGVDFGCQAMRNYSVFMTERYYGVDLDKRALEAGKRRHPRAIPIHAHIENAEVPPADFALCINVFHGTNFRGSDADEVLRSMVEKIAPGGALILTVQPNKVDMSHFRSVLRVNFRRVEEVRHDLPNKPHSVFAPIIASRYHRAGITPEKPLLIYFRCLERRAG